MWLVLLHCADRHAANLCNCTLKCVCATLQVLNSVKYSEEGKDQDVQVGAADPVCWVIVTLLQQAGVTGLGRIGHTAGCSCRRHQPDSCMLSFRAAQHPPPFLLPQMSWTLGAALSMLLGYNATNPAGIPV